MFILRLDFQKYVVGGRKKNKTAASSLWTCPRYVLFDFALKEATQAFSPFPGKYLKRLGTFYYFPVSFCKSVFSVFEVSFAIITFFRLANSKLLSLDFILGLCVRENECTIDGVIKVVSMQYGTLSYAAVLKNNQS